MIFNKKTSTENEKTKRQLPEWLKMPKFDHSAVMVRIKNLPRLMAGLIKKGAIKLWDITGGKLWVAVGAPRLAKLQAREDWEKISHRVKHGRELAIWGTATIALCAITACGITLGYANGVTKNSYYALNVNDQQVAMVKTESQAYDLIDEYLEAKCDKAEVDEAFISERIDIVRVAKTDQLQVDSFEDAMNKLAANTTVMVPGAEVLVDGVSTISVGSVDEAKVVLEKLKAIYVPADTSFTVTDCKFKEDVQVSAAFVNADEVLTENQALLALRGTTATESYVYFVQTGDTLESIAASQGVTMASLVSNNDWIDFDDLQFGQKVKIKAEDPKINVLTVIEKTKTVIIPYETKYETNRKMAAGTSEVKQAGVNGEEEVTLKIVRQNGTELYRERLNSTVLTAAVDQIVIRGASVQTASRGSVVSNGSMIWPTSAKRISSYYGKRSSGYHDGLDIDGDSGDAVWATKGGTVVSAGWQGSYGYCVTINHGNGVKTRYAHLKSISVSADEAVSAGETIGTMGSTGNSTGSHLHLEVIVNGEFKNPLSYLSR